MLPTLRSVSNQLNVYRISSIYRCGHHGWRKRTIPQWASRRLSDCRRQMRPTGGGHSQQMQNLLLDKEDIIQVENTCHPHILWLNPGNKY